MKKYQFAVGIWQDRTVTVRARDYEEAVFKARGELDRRAEKRGDEPPVAWDLTLIKEEEIK